MPSPKARHGIVALEFATGLLLLLAMTILFLGVSTKRHRAASRLASERAAIRIAEQALLTLRSGDTLAGDSVVLRALPDPAPQHFRWVEVRATVEGRTASLVGLVPGQEAR